MCGICFCLISSQINSISFDFSPYLSLIENSFATLNFKDFPYSPEITSDYFQHCCKNNLFFEDFTLSDIENCLKPRGPDSYGLQIQNNDLSISYVPKLLSSKKLFENLAKINTESPFKTIAAGSVLHLRGEENKPNNMPLCDLMKTGNFFLYNGEIYSLKKKMVSLLPEKIKKLGFFDDFNIYDNDTKQLFWILNRFSEIYYFSQQKKENTFDYENDILSIIDCFHGDFSFVFEDKLNNLITIGKDIYGKKSLLLGFNKFGFCISSCAPNFGQKKLNPENNENDKNDENDEHDKNDENDKGFLMKKYLSEFLTSRDKEWLELPPQSLTFIKIICQNEDNKGVWLKFSNKKYPSNGVFSVPHLIVEEKKEEINEEEIVKRALLKSVKRILKNIIEFKGYFMKPNKNCKNVKNDENPQELKILNDSKNNSTSSKIAIMFSGGLDSTLIAHMVNLILPMQERYFFRIFKNFFTIFFVFSVNFHFFFCIFKKLLKF